jgi:Holliday junction resolvase-like predicted endonuclease
MNQPLINIILSILEKTKKQSVDLEVVKDSLRITREAFEENIDKLRKDRLLPFRNKVKPNVQQRLGLAILAIEAGADIHRVSNTLLWLEFEELVAHVFEENGYNAIKRYRFQADGRRWEIDVLATKYPYIICAECKHYSRGIGNSTAQGIIETHLEKTEVFSKNIEKYSKEIKVHRWKDAIIIPITLSLNPTKMKVYRRVPSVSVFALPNYLNEFQGNLERLMIFRVKIPIWLSKPRQLKLR